MTENSNHEPSGQSSLGQQGSCLGKLAIGLLFCWIIVTSLVIQGIDWLAPLLQAQSSPARQTAMQAMLVGTPAAILSRLWPIPSHRSIFRVWTWAAICLLALAPTRLLPPVASQSTLLLQVTILALLSIAVHRYHDHVNQPHAASKPEVQSGIWTAILVAGLVAVPWVVAGALGSWLDTIAAIGAGAIAGHLFGAIISATWHWHTDSGQKHQLWTVIKGGVVITGVLNLIASGLSQNGVQLLLLVAVPALGWPMMAICTFETKYNLRPAATFCGILFVTILAFVDNDATSPIVLDPLLGWYWLAAVATISIGWVSIALWLTSSRRWIARPATARLTSASLLTWVAVTGVYFTAGNPGFFGDHLFVILNEQTNLANAELPKKTEYQMRKHAIYQLMTEHAQISQQPLLRRLDKIGIKHTSFYLVNAIELEGNLPLYLWLGKQPEIDRIIASPRLRPLPIQQKMPNGRETPPIRPQWNITMINADKVWKNFGVRGQNIVIGHSDSGVDYNHPDLAEQYLGTKDQHQYTWHDPWHHSTQPHDPSGHGTHTLGTILGKKTGVAPAAHWIGCANLPRNLGNPAIYLKCMQFTFAPFPSGGDALRDGKTSLGAHILNNSWGCPERHEGCDNTTLEYAMVALRAAGIFVTVSAGNSGPACATIDTPPAIYDEVFTVGALDRHGNLARFSSTGPTTSSTPIVKPDMLAPGQSVTSTYPGASYATTSGTSMAAPHVTGVVALMWSANPNLIGYIDTTEEILYSTAKPFTGSLANGILANITDVEPIEGNLISNTIAQVTATLMPKCQSNSSNRTVPNNIAGYGIVNAYDAVKSAVAANPNYHPKK